MSALKEQLPEKMTVAQFMQWYESQEGKWELHDGVPVRKHDPTKGHAEQAGHARAKHAIAKALEAAVATAQLKCEVLPDGMSVEIDKDKSYEPDAILYCGQRLEDNALYVPNPVIIVEVLSPSTAWKDVSTKLEDYFTLKTMQHYLIIDPVRKSVMHHYRDGSEIQARAVSAGRLKLDPPGMILDIESVFS